MSAQTNTATQEKEGETTMSSIVWFDFPTDDVDRAKSFYGTLFGWKFERLPGEKEYWHIDTGGAEGSPDGGLLKRQHPQHQGVTNYISVPSVDEAAAKVEQLGGKICMPKTAVPQMGYFVICQDPDNNMFALWESSDSAI